MGGDSFSWILTAVRTDSRDPGWLRSGASTRHATGESTILLKTGDRRKIATSVSASLMYVTWRFCSTDELLSLVFGLHVDRVMSRVQYVPNLPPGRRVRLLGNHPKSGQQCTIVDALPNPSQLARNQWYDVRFDDFSYGRFNQRYLAPVATGLGSPAA